jgi:hypothetical protein
LSRFLGEAGGGGRLAKQAAILQQNRLDAGFHNPFWSAASHSSGVLRVVLGLDNGRSSAPIRLFDSSIVAPKNASKRMS